MPRTNQCQPESFPDRDHADRDAERAAPKATKATPSTTGATRRGFTTRKPRNPIEARRAAMIPVAPMPGTPYGAETLQSNARNAAGLALRGSGWSAEDRAECAAHVICRVLEDETAYQDGDYVSARRASVTRCYGLAGDWTRHEHAEAKAAKNAEQLAEAVGTGFIPNVEPWEAEGTTMCRAAMKAAELADAVGIDLEAPDRDAMALLYSVARSADGYQGAEAAHELGLNLNTHRSHVARAKKAAAARGTLEDWRTALAEDDRTPTRARAVNLDDFRDDVRRVPAAPVRNYRDPAKRRDMRRKHAPHWTATLTPAKHARLKVASGRQRATAKARTAEDRRMVRRSAGLPATVR